MQVVVSTDRTLANVDPNVELRVATAVLEAQRAIVTLRDDGIIVELPRERL